MCVLGGLSATAFGILAVTAAAAVISGVLFVLARRRRGTPGSDSFARFALAVALWNAFVVLTHLAPDRSAVLALDTIAAIASMAVAFLWFEFTVSYTGYGDRLTQRRRILLWLQPAAFAINEIVQLTRSSPDATGDIRAYEGLWFVVDSIDSPLAVFWTAVPFALTLVAFGLLARFVLSTRGGYQKQAATVFSGALLAFLGIALHMAAGLGPVEGFDPTPMANALMAILVAIALFRWGFLEVVPVATDVLFEEMADPVVVLAANGSVAAANPAAGRLADTDLVGTHLPESLPVLDAALREDAETVSVDRGSSGERTYDVNVSPLSDPYGRQRGRLVVLRDVTDTVRRERELKRQNERLDRFTSVVSHDLRNPLNVAHAFTQEAKETGEIDHLDRSLAALDDMEALIQDLLTLAREGRTVDETTWLSFAEVAEGAWPFVDEGPTLSIESTGEIDADPGRLAELLGNCFRNARDHGGDAVTVWVGVTDDGFYVEDDGQGVPEPDRESVFESGYSTAEGGTGLGLAIVSDIANAHGWSIQVTAGRDGGARFEISGVAIRERSGADTTVVGRE